MMTATKERPILFSGPMVRAILEGRKTQTRRIVKSEAKNMQAAGQECIHRNPDNDHWYKQHIWSVRGASGIWNDYTNEQMMARCPYGAPGDRLWVRETWRVRGGAEYEYQRHQPSVVYRATADTADAVCGEWKPSIFMRRWASRLLLEVEAVRVEQLQTIREADCRAEGCSGGHDSIPAYPFSATPLEHYRSVWTKINGEKGWKSWDSNPWVWVVQFVVRDSSESK